MALESTALSCIRPVRERHVHCPGLPRHQCLLCPRCLLWLAWASVFTVSTGSTVACPAICVYCVHCVYCGSPRHLCLRDQNQSLGPWGGMDPPGFSVDIDQDDDDQSFTSTRLAEHPYDIRRLSPLNIHKVPICVQVCQSFLVDIGLVITMMMSLSHTQG